MFTLLVDWVYSFLCLPAPHMLLIFGSFFNPNVDQNTYINEGKTYYHGLKFVLVPPLSFSLSLAE